MQLEDLVKTALAEIKTLPDDEFGRKYRASKARYQAVAKSLEWLNRLKVLLEQPEDLDIDHDVLTDIEVIQHDLNDVLVRMHSGAMWTSEDDDDE